jgi:hypothetical protein
MSSTAEIIRDFVADNYPESDHLINTSAIMLLACADTIDRLTRQRNMAIAIAYLLSEEKHEPDNPGRST